MVNKKLIKSTSRRRKLSKTRRTPPPKHIFHYSDYNVLLLADCHLLLPFIIIRIQDRHRGDRQINIALCVVLIQHVQGKEKNKQQLNNCPDEWTRRAERRTIVKIPSAPCHTPTRRNYRTHVLQ